MDVIILYFVKCIVFGELMKIFVIPNNLTKLVEFAKKYL